MTMTAKEFLERMKHGKIHIKADKCAIGGEELHTTITGRNRTQDGDVCDDHYFDALGKIIEKHPIVTPRIRRG